MKNLVHRSFKQIKTYCEKENYKGWDPYDGLNSKLFQALPLKNWPFARLAWIQLFKRNPINLRQPLLVPKGLNPKALGLFLTAYCNIYRFAEVDEKYGSKEEIKERINYLVDLLINLKTDGYSGACWGYNFDWQARGGLFFPAYTPTVVATTYATYGLLDAWEILQDEKIKKIAVSSAEFIINDLSRTEKEEGFLFSYAPMFGNNEVYNASLLSSRLLARVYSLSNNEQYIEAARNSVIACCNGQNSDGSWYYGEFSHQGWIDSFHTGFNLEAIHDYQSYTGDSNFRKYFEKGFDFYVKNFFLTDGTPKYYHDQTYPIDIHSPAQLIVTLVKSNRLKNHSEMASKVITWTLDNMWDEDGYFYYQIKKSHKNKISYMRWSQAWMFCALSYYILGADSL